jgi:hypothetical protein
LGNEKPGISTRSLTNQERENAAGQYATHYGYVNVISNDNGLTAEIDGESIDFVAREDGRYGVRYKLLGVIPIQADVLAEVGFSLRSISGHDLLLAYYQDQTFVIGEKIKPVPITASLRRLIGDYQIVNLAGGDALVPEKCALRERDGFLMLEYSFPEFDINNLMSPIAPISDSEAIILGMGSGKQETIRIVKIDGKEFVAYSGYLLQKQP